MKKQVSIVLLVLIAVIVALYLSLPLLVSQEKVSSLIRHHAQEALGKDFRFERLNLVVLPKFSIEITKINIPEFKKNVELKDNSHTLTCSVRADSLRFTIKLIPLLFKKVSIASVSFKNVAFDGVLESLLTERNEEGTGETFTKNVFFTLSDLNGKVSDLALGRPIAYEIEGNLGNDESICKSKGTFLLTKKDLALKWSASETMITNGNLEVARLFCDYFDLPLTFEQGIVNGRIKIKQQGSSITVDNDLIINDLIYSESFKEKERTSIAFDCALKGGVSATIDKGIAEFDDLQLTVKDSDIKGVGKVSWVGEPSWDVTLYSAKTSLDTVPLIVPIVSENLPYNVGFSGTVAFDVVAKRSEGVDSFNANVDLKNTVLSVTQYFSKSKDLPMHINARFGSQDGISYAGDTTVILGDMNFKATVTKFDLKEKMLEGSFITNNFNVDNWDEFLIVLKDKNPTGTVKLFGSGKVDLKDVKDATYTGGIVMDSLSAEIEPGLALRNIGMSVNINDRRISCDKVRLQVNDSLLDGSFQIMLKPSLVFDVLLTGNEVDLSFCDKYFDYTSPAVWREDVKKKVQASGQSSAASPNNLPVDAVQADATKAQQTAKDPAAVQSDLKQSVTGTSRCVLSFGNAYLLGNTFKDVNIRLKETNGLVVLEEGICTIAEGKAAVTGTLNIKNLAAPAIGDFGGKVLINGLKLGKLQGYLQDVSNAADGTAEAEVTVQGTGAYPDIPKTMKGSGTVTVTEGKLKQIDFIEILSRFDMFFGLGEKSKGYTDFSRIEYIFKLFDGKVDSNHIKMYSNLYDVEGMGTYSFDSTINYRITVLLNSTLSRKIMPNIVEGERFKVPVQIYNTVNEPKFSVERAVAQDLVATAVNKGINKLLDELKVTPPKTSETPQSQPQSSDGRSQPIS
ncbi:MAG: hypothetical protein JW938_02900 [Candidatus Omnitrophica bacterium]|nr:hypothetical protein [Candidatus Omnitrophota bacterium]